jgi:DNA polymerase
MLQISGKGEAVLEKLRRESAKCIRCPLYKNATQTVFGEGPAGADLMLVGEQPGDQEDLAGRPFVGPAGQLLDRALAKAGIAREKCYVTNAVKHFKFEQRGKRRLHKRPNAGEIEACRWWLDREILAVQPKLIIALGATAASALLGKTATISRLRGHIQDFGDYPGWVTVHPSYLLRIPDRAAAQQEFHRFVGDLRAAQTRLAKAA